jgi:hypothetical protein
VRRFNNRAPDVDGSISNIYAHMSGRRFVGVKRDSYENLANVHKTLQHVSGINNLYVWHGQNSNGALVMKILKISVAWLNVEYKDKYHCFFRNEEAVLENFAATFYCNWF